MSGILPNTRPRAAFTDLMKMIDGRYETLTAEPVFLLGVRGYYRDTMGKPGQNDRGLYDDAMFIMRPRVREARAFNANTDPSAYRAGTGTGARKGMATLALGGWKYQIGLHRGLYTALRQAEPVLVVRDGRPAYEDRGWFGINIHKGSRSRTSSLGCQTIPPAQWDEFIGHVRNEMKMYQMKTIPYILVAV